MVRLRRAERGGELTASVQPIAGAQPLANVRKRGRMNIKDEMKTKLGFVSGADVSRYACVD